MYVYTPPQGHHTPPHPMGGVGTRDTGPYILYTTESLDVVDSCCSYGSLAAIAAICKCHHYNIVTMRHSTI